ncbi:polyprenyl synthetase family protein [Corynebacterium aquatimens]|uniref:Geranylgeranyl diphosphate synthase type I n=1 Tax=Corynebacterium aquatimens TaxID=1190508 RepID=A0A931E2D1_9CORY|nr:polyprenyl synthetase family protein [Corynebacterium aquatimens]MBG6121976.1 geranylgeranyl diphosphate synthase type I [Corynebacterium aquatimens]
MTPASLPLSSLPRAVEDALARYFDRRVADVEPLGPPVLEAVEHLRNFVHQGGKRLRPVFAWTGFVGSRGAHAPEEDPAAVLAAVSSLELIQACALIHDDIIDASDTRRGNPTVHRAVAHDHARKGWRGESDNFGEHIAILVGDLALAWADDMLVTSGLSADARERARTPWMAMRTEVIGGQILDISLEASGDESLASATTVSRFKTAAYTIERPLHLGAAIAGAPAETINALRGYGHDIGIAFQLRDDVLGVFGKEHETGKPVGDDIREGKRTALLAHALAALDVSDPEAASYVRSIVGASENPDDLARVSALIESSGAVDVVEATIADLTRSGLAYLDDADLTPQAREDLRVLAVKATERTS